MPEDRESDPARILHPVLRCMNDKQASRHMEERHGQGSVAFGDPRLGQHTTILISDAGHTRRLQVPQLHHHGRPAWKAMGYRQQHIGPLRASVCSKSLAGARVSLVLTSLGCSVYHREVPWRVYLARGMVILLDLASQTTTGIRSALHLSLSLYSTKPATMRGPISSDPTVWIRQYLAGRDIKQFTRKMEMIRVWVHGSATSRSRFPIFFFPP